MTTEKYVLENLLAIVELNARDDENPGLDIFDQEAEHKNADRLLCSLLSDLGYTDIVDAYNKIHKWYA